MVTLYNVVSSDWFIADKDGEEDFIPDELWQKTLEVFSRFDTLVMGRKTYEALQAYPAALLQPFENLNIRKVVVSEHHEQLKNGYVLCSSPEEAIRLGSNTIVSSGPTLNNYLLEHRLVNMVILHEIPIALNEGVPVFDASFKDMLVLESESDTGGAKELVYRIR